MIPLLKGKDLDKSLPESFRPVSQLPIISKLTERVMQSQLLQYLEETSQLSDRHHAYRNKYSTTTALIHLMDQIAQATDNNLISTTMNIDLNGCIRLR